MPVMPLYCFMWIEHRVVCGPELTGSGLASTAAFVSRSQHVLIGWRPTRFKRVKTSTRNGRTLVISAQRRLSNRHFCFLSDQWEQLGSLTDTVAAFAPSMSEPYQHQLCAAYLACSLSFNFLPSLPVVRVGNKGVQSLHNPYVTPSLFPANLQ